MNINGRRRTAAPGRRAPFWRRRHAARRVFDIIIPVLPDRLEPLERLLAEIGGPSGGKLRASARIDFSKLTTTHFLRWLIVPDEAKEAQPPRHLLVFESNFDGGLDDYMAELVAVAGKELREIYQHCGYPTGDARDTDAALRQFLRAASTQRCATFYQAYPHMTVQRIRSNAALRDCIEQLLDSYRKGLDWKGTPQRSLSPEELEATFQLLQLRIRQCIEDHPGLLPEDNFLRRLQEALARRTPWVLLAPWALLAVCLLPVIIPAGLLASYLLLRQEEQDEEQRLQELRDAEEVEALKRPEDGEDFQPQNQLTHLIEIKEGPLRWCVIRVVLGTLQLLARHFFIHGRLGSLQNIHFANWRFFAGQRLLFCSNYDGSFESYLGDFIDRASSGLNSIWCNTRRFPRTGWLFRDGGALQEEDFKQWTRSHQVVPLVWYSAHPDKSVQNILEDQEFCSRLRRMTAAELGKWLPRL